MPENLRIDLCLDEDDFPPMPPLEDAEEVKLDPEETISEKTKFNPRKRKNTGKGLKILMPSKLLTRLIILLVQIKSRNNSNKLNNEIRQILYLLYQHSKMTKKVCNNLIKSL